MTYDDKYYGCMVIAIGSDKYVDVFPYEEQVPPATTTTAFFFDHGTLSTVVDIDSAALSAFTSSNPYEGFNYADWGDYFYNFDLATLNTIP
ncbi:hypothetical protein [Vibrio comitans]|uniref:Uncharacterized protein n=1 Tax=Vibrio comitans NBRC 102076 TaxID=1219078 RepID=A0A4Y3IHT6_9VIBR|nr:hypothetical protein [Vibrio comitans]GEA58906.1 hypothetical protein VCO01S_00990 [Vibrio comitans NBRC 102076]